jgi:hypothetical protein
MSLIVQAVTEGFGLILVEVDTSHPNNNEFTFKGKMIYVEKPNTGYRSDVQAFAYVGYESATFSSAYYNYPQPATIFPMSKALTINLIL